ncbi:MAG: hypothetical protein SFU21_12065 [Flavihumibacter sp.]|nr:hypothetical protein [Flavihumibacter sp.]
MTDPGSKSDFTSSSDYGGKGNESIDSSEQSTSRGNENGTSSSGSNSSSSNSSSTSRDLYDNLSQ